MFPGSTLSMCPHCYIYCIINHTSGQQNTDCNCLRFDSFDWHIRHSCVSFTMSHTYFDWRLDARFIVARKCVPSIARLKLCHTKPSVNRSEQEKEINHSLARTHQNIPRLASKLHHYQHTTNDRTHRCLFATSQHM